MGPGLWFTLTPKAWTNILYLYFIHHLLWKQAMPRFEDTRFYFFKHSKIMLKLKGCTFLHHFSLKHNYTVLISSEGWTNIVYKHLLFNWQTNMASCHLSFFSMYFLRFRQHSPSQSINSPVETANDFKMFIIKLKYIS